MPFDAMQLSWAEAPAHAGSPFAPETGREFLRCYNRQSFAFRHSLSEHPLFQPPSLAEMAKRQGDQPDVAYWSNGTVQVKDRWEKGATKSRSLDDTIAGIDENNSLVMFKHVERDNILGPLISEIIVQIVELCGSRMQLDVIVGRATILLASPHRITSYHIDADTNFLFQIAGDKTIRVFDQTDRTLLTDEELERYHAGDANGATYKAARGDDANIYALAPGCGVHIPSQAPHWAQNNGKVSVALSLNYDLRSVQRDGRIYSINGRLRRLGMKPTPPGVSAVRDQVKLFISGNVHALRRVASFASPERHH